MALPTDTQAPTDAQANAERLNGMFAHEKYIYRGKLYSYKQVYNASRTTQIIAGVYGAIVLIVVLAVLWYTYVAPGGFNFSF